MHDNNWIKFEPQHDVQLLSTNQGCAFPASVTNTIPQVCVECLDEFTQRQCLRCGIAKCRGCDPLTRFECVCGATQLCDSCGSMHDHNDHVCSVCQLPTCLQCTSQCKRCQDRICTKCIIMIGGKGRCATCSVCAECCRDITHDEPCIECNQYHCSWCMRSCARCDARMCDKCCVTWGGRDLCQACTYQVYVM